MKLRDFRIGWRLLIKEPGYSAVVILGLSIGFAVCFLLMAYVRFCLSYDNAVPQSDRVFMVQAKMNALEKSDWSEIVQLPYFDVIQKSGLVESATITALQPVPFKVNNHVFQLDLLLVHDAFPAMFAVRVSEGDLRPALTEPDKLALTESAALKLFGDLHVIGKIVTISGKSYGVTALLRDPSPNSSINYAALGAISNASWPDDERSYLFHSWSSLGPNKIFLKLKPGVSATALSQILQDAADHSPYIARLDAGAIQKLTGKKAVEMRLVAMPDLYFDNATANTMGSGLHGDRRAVLGLAAVASLILLLSATNYVNLTTVRTLGRQREIAMRKVMGASVGRLLLQFISESVLVAMIATVLGLLLACFLLPVFSELVNRPLDNAFTPWAIFISIVIGAAVGTAAGIYPAWVALQVRPPQTLAGRGSSETSGGQWLRRVLTVIQFSVAMMLTAVTFTIAWQTWFSMQSNPGFDPEQMLVIELPGDVSNQSARNLSDEIRKFPGVIGMASSAGPVGNKFVGLNDDLINEQGRRASVVWRQVGANFFDVFNVLPLAGRLFDPKIDKEITNGQEWENWDDGAIVLNPAAVRNLGFATPEASIGHLLKADWGKKKITLRVIGVAPEIRHESLHQPPGGVAYMAVSMGPIAPCLNIRTSGDLAALEGEATRLAQKYYPDDVVPIHREKSYLVGNYEDDARLAKLLAVATIIALAIASFGIYVLSTYSVQRLSKQIVLRRLFGAGGADIVRLVGREFVMLISVSGLIGLPVAVVLNERYLSAFVERAPMGAWPIVVALGIGILTALLSTTRQTMKTLSMAPASILDD